MTAAAASTWPAGLAHGRQALAEQRRGRRAAVAVGRRRHRARTGEGLDDEQRQALRFGDERRTASTPAPARSAAAARPATSSRSRRPSATGARPAPADGGRERGAAIVEVLGSPRQQHEHRAAASRRTRQGAPRATRRPPTGRPRRRPGPGCRRRRARPATVGDRVEEPRPAAGLASWPVIPRRVGSVAA